MSSITTRILCDNCLNEFDITSPDSLHTHPVQGQPNGRDFLFVFHSCTTCDNRVGIAWMTEDEFSAHFGDETHRDIS